MNERNFRDLDNLDKLLDNNFKGVSYLKVRDKRAAIGTVAKQGVEFTSGIATAQNFKNVGSHILKVMPSGNELNEELKEIDGQFGELKQEFKDTLANITGGARSYAGAFAESKRAFLPKSIANRLDNFAHANDDAAGKSEEAQRDEDIKSQLKAVFSTGASTVKELKTTNVAQQQLASVTRSIGRAQLATLSQIAGHLSFANKYTADTTRNYMRKSLELQYRHLYIAKDQLAVLRTMSDGVLANMSAVVKNTSLPDQLKFQGLEVSQQKIYNRIYDRGITALSDLSKRVFDRIRGSILDSLGIVGDSLYMAGDGTEADALTSGFNETSTSRRAGSVVGNLLGGAATKYLGKRYGGAVNQADLAVGNVINMIRSGGRAGSLVAARSNNPLIRALSGVMATGDTDVNVGNSLLTHGTKPAIFDHVFHSAVVEIIPAWLSRIDKHIVDMQGAPSEEGIYDVTLRRIVPRSQAKANIAESIFGSRGSRSGGYGQSVGATMTAFDKSGLSFASTRKDLEDAIGKIIANAIAIRLPLHPQYLEPFLTMTNDTEITDSTLQKLFKGVDNKVDVAQALYFMMTTANGRENLSVTTAINSGIYREINGEGVQQKLIDMVNNYGYHSLFDSEINKEGVLSQSWITDQIRDVTRRNYRENYASGAGIYTTGQRAYENDIANISELLGSKAAVKLVGGPGRMVGEFGDTKYATYQKSNTSAYKQLARVFDTNEMPSIEDFLKQLEKVPGADSEKMRQAFNIVQQMKIIQLEKQLLAERQKSSSDESSSSEPGVVYRTNSIPDVNFYDDDPKGAKAFRMRYGTYAPEHRPYLMDVSNKIIMRKTLQDIHQFLRIRFSSIPTWRRVQFRLLEGITTAITTKLPKLLGKIIFGTIGKVAKGIWTHLNETFGWFNGKSTRLKQKETQAALIAAVRAQEETSRWNRLLNATEKTATETELAKEAIIATYIHSRYKGNASDKERKAKRRLQLELGMDRHGNLSHIDPENVLRNVEDEARDEVIELKSSDSRAKKSMSDIASLTGKLSWLKLVNSAKTYGGLIPVTMIAAGIGKMIYDIKQAGGFGGYIKESGMRLGLTKPFTEEGIYEPLYRQTKDVRKTKLKMFDEYGFSSSQVKAYNDAEKSGDTEAMSAIIQAQRETLKIKGTPLAKKGDWDFPHALHHVRDTVAKKTKYKPIKLTDADDAMLVNMLKEGGDDAAFEATIEMLINKRTLEEYNALPKKRVGDANRAEQLTARRKKLIKNYKMPKGVLDEYEAFVEDKNSTPEQAAEFIARWRISQFGDAEDNREVQGIWIKRAGKKFLKTIFTDGRVNFVDYGLNNSQWDFASKLYGDGWYWELQWFLDDCLWKVYANSKYDKESRHKGFASMFKMSQLPGLMTGIGAPVELARSLGTAISKRGSLGAFGRGATGLVKKFAKSKFGAGYTKFVTRVGKQGLGKTIGSGIASLLNKTKFGGEIVAKGNALNSFFSKVRTSVAKGVPLLQNAKWVSKIKTLLSVVKAPGALIKKIFWFLRGAGKLFAKYSPWIFFGSLIYGLCVGIYRWVKHKPTGFEDRFKGNFLSDIIQIILVAIDPYQIGLAVVAVIREALGAKEAAKEKKSSKNALKDQLKQLNTAVSAKLVELVQMQSEPSDDNFEAREAGTASMKRLAKSENVSEANRKAIEEYLDGLLATAAEAGSEASETEPLPPEDQKKLDALLDETSKSNIVTKDQAKKLKQEREARISASELLKDPSVTKDEDRAAIKELIDNNQIAEATKYRDNLAATNKEKLKIVQLLASGKINRTTRDRLYKLLDEDKVKEVYEEFWSNPTLRATLTNDKLEYIRKYLDKPTEFQMWKTSVNENAMQVGQSTKNSIINAGVATKNAAVNAGTVIADAIGNYVIDPVTGLAHRIADIGKSNDTKTATESPIYFDNMALSTTLATLNTTINRLNVAATAQVEATTKLATTQTNSIVAARNSELSVPAIKTKTTPF